MTCNIGKTDRIIRTIVGLTIIGTGIYYGSWWGLVGVIPLLTAIGAYCPAYQACGHSTCETPSQGSKDEHKKACCG